MPTLPCRTLDVTSFDIINPDNQRRTSPATPPTKSRTTKHSARVLHLDHYGLYSIVDINFIADLWVNVHGSKKPLPRITSETRVTLQWHYPSMTTSEQTTFRVVRDVTYPVILRKEDWVEPIKRLRFHEQQRSATHPMCTTPGEADDEVFRAASETDCETTQWDHSSPSSPVYATSVDEDWQSAEDTNTSCGYRHQAELADSDPRALESTVNHYWIWDEKRGYYHQEFDGTITKFPDLD